MIRFNQIKLPVGHTTEDLENQIRRLLQIGREQTFSYEVGKRSLDARKKPQLFYVYSVDVCIEKEERILQKRKGSSVQRIKKQSYHVPNHGSHPLLDRPVIVGSGPAGLFCAYLLARSGYRPLVLERGGSVRERQNDVEKFWETGILDPNSNVQFGEGGAGTFSDGKLNTLVKDKMGRNRFVLETFVSFGAPSEILYDQKPHIGTDLLIQIVERMREDIQKHGGEFRFHAQVTDFFPDSQQLEVNCEERIPCGVTVLAIGHSARDTFHMLYEKGLPMQAKSFAVGVRVEHPQSWIDVAQYGQERGELLPAAAYKLAETLENGRGVYTFCMCPGGYVVNASSEEHQIAVNGMSYHDRSGENANSAVIVTVTPEDYGLDHPLAGVAFQRSLEKKAWLQGKGKIPVQRFADFCQDRETQAFGVIRPNTKGSCTPANVRRIFPEEIASSIQQGIQKMDRKIHGFAQDDVLLSGVESRTSSPVRIERNDQLVSEKFPWIYPCGEGAGYAGGITSAAMDGMKVAEEIIKKYKF